MRTEWSLTLAERVFLGGALAINTTCLFAVMFAFLNEHREVAASTAETFEMAYYLLFLMIFMGVGLSPLRSVGRWMIGGIVGRVVA